MDSNRPPDIIKDTPTETPEDVSKRIKEEDSAYIKARRDAIDKANKDGAANSGVEDDSYKAALKVIVKRNPPKDIQEQKNRVAKYKDLAEQSYWDAQEGKGSPDDHVDYRNRYAVELEILEDMTHDVHRKPVDAAKTVDKNSTNQVREIPPATQPIPTKPINTVKSPTTNATIPQPSVKYSEQDYTSRNEFIAKSQNEFMAKNSELQREYYIPEHIMLRGHEAGASLIEYDDVTGKVLFKDDEGNIVYENQVLYPSRGRVNVVKEYIEKAVPDAGVKVSVTAMDELYERVSESGASLDNMEIVKIDDIEKDEDFKYFREQHDKKWDKLDKKFKYKKSGYAIIVRDDDGDIVAAAPVYDVKNKAGLRRAMRKLAQIKK